MSRSALAVATAELRGRRRIRLAPTTCQKNPAGGRQIRPLPTVAAGMSTSLCLAVPRDDAIKARVFIITRFYILDIYVFLVLYISHANRHTTQHPYQRARSPTAHESLHGSPRRRAGYRA